ncbi:MAG: leucine-rich repeat domain-containing protein [Candidatus Lokiarchaeota archaeon]|nr:leucine-rich repeat domain-containing protein [Candidatus Lokiarchaeota archaeon]
MSHKEFKINDYITLKLENDNTIIYVDEKPFTQCNDLRLVFHFDQERKLMHEEIESIDEIVGNFRMPCGRTTFNGGKIEYSSIEAFWGHCSNLQVWAEHDYDTRLLTFGLSFPLLERLIGSGDKLAKSMFKDEIVKRMRGKNQIVISYLIKNDYLKYFTESELEARFPEWEFVEIYSKRIPVINGVLNLSNKGINSIEEIKNLGNLTSICKLDLHSNNLKEHLSSIGNLNSLRNLDLSFNQLNNIPNSICNLKSLEILSLIHNNLKSLPESIGNLTSLQKIDLRHNHITHIPKSIEMLNKLRELNLVNNPVSKKDIDRSLLKHFKTIGTDIFFN